MARRVRIRAAQRSPAPAAVVARSPSPLPNPDATKTSNAGIYTTKTQTRSRSRRASWCLGALVFFSRCTSIRGPVFVRELPPARVVEHRSDVVVGVGHGVARGAVANFKVYDIFVGGVDEMMAVPTSGLEAGAHSGCERGFPLVGEQKRPASQDVHELVLLGVRVPQRRYAAWCEASQVDPEVEQVEYVAERALLAAGHARRKRLRIVGRFLPRHSVGGDNCYWSFCLRHRYPPSRCAAGRFVAELLTTRIHI